MALHPNFTPAKRNYVFIYEVRSSEVNTITVIWVGQTGKKIVWQAYMPSTLHAPIRI